MGGYGFLGFRDGVIPQPATGVHDPVWSRSIVISDGNNTIAVSVLDVTGITNKVLNTIRSAVLRETGIPVSNIFISATHTHCGPDFQGLWGGVTDSYRDFVINGTITSIINAYKTRRPADLYASSATGTARNRRGWDYTDTDIIVLDAIDKVTQQRIGTLVNFAAHPTVLGHKVREISGDWPHYLRVVSEEKLGAPVIFQNGAIGDVVPSSTIGDDDFEKAEYYGTQIANLAIDSISNKVLINGDIYISSAFYPLGVSNRLFTLALNLGLIDYEYEGGPVQGYTIRTRANYFRLGGQVQGVAFPGESLTRNAEPIKGSMTAPFKLFFGLSGDTLGYFVPTDEWETGRNGDYEEGVSLDKFAGDITRDKLIDLINGDPKNNS